MSPDLTKPIFTDEAKAREYLESVRWPRGTICPHCGAIKSATKMTGKSHRPGLYQCNECREPFTVTVGTVYERSHIPLNKWLLATHLMCASKKGISAHQLHRMLGITYKSAWFMAHRIREAMKVEHVGPMGSNGGTVEADETFWGNNKKVRNSPGRGYAHKMKVFALVERDGTARSFKVERVNSATLAPILREHVAKDATLYTDEGSHYTIVGREFAKHEVVAHGAKEYARGKIHTNTIEGYFSLLKRGLVGTFHHVGEHHLGRYCIEFDFRWNHRKTTDSERADAALRGISGKRLMYNQPH